METTKQESKTMGGLSIRQGVWPRLWITAMLMLAGCDAGPSAVMHDGDGEGASSPSAMAAAPVKPGGDEPAEVSMPIIDGSTSSGSASATVSVDHSIAPQYGTALKIARGDRPAISETSYGDWPLWSKNRKYSPDDNAHYQFDKHGVEFGAKSYADYLAMVHGFVHSPPTGTETISRVNGDTLFYNARDNVFAVMTRTGAPRTMFRPDSGKTYWEQQKVVEAERAQKRNSGED